MLNPGKRKAQVDRLPQVQRARLASAAAATAACGHVSPCGRRGRGGGKAMTNLLRTLGDGVQGPELNRTP